MKRLLFAAMIVCSLNLHAQFTFLSAVKEQGRVLKDWWFNGGRSNYLQAKLKAKQAKYDEKWQRRINYEQEKYKVFDKVFLKRAEERLKVKMPLAGFETEEKIHNARLYNIGIKKYRGPHEMFMQSKVGIALASKFKNFSIISH